MHPQTALGKTVRYTPGEWEKLLRYLDHAEPAPDTDRLENRTGRNPKLIPTAPGSRATLTTDSRGLGAHGFRWVVCIMRKERAA